jgi:ABC-2 type transport system permease protein
MPEWAQWLGELLPTTHFLRIVRGVLLKGNGWPEVMPDAWPIALFMVIVIAIGLRFFRSTLD